MKVIIVGAGKVGLAITRQLASEGHDITVIELDEKKLDLVSGMYDVITLQGSGVSFAVLREADAAHADLFIAATGSDEANMVSSVAARHMGAKNVAIRLKDPEYSRERRVMQEVFGVSAVFNPDMDTAGEIARILQFPTAARVETFARGRGELVEYRVPAGSELDGLQLKDLSRKFKTQVLVCAVERGNAVCIPNGEFILLGGDRLSIAGTRSDVRRFFTAADAYKEPVRRTILLGGSRIAAYLARQLLDAGIRVTIIEQRRERCEELCGMLPDADVICGDGCKQEVLLEEGIRSTDAFVALTGFDEDNIIVSMYALECGVGKVVTKLSDDHFISMLERSGLDCFICPKLLAAGEIAQYARATQNAEGSSVEALYRLIDNKVEALEFLAGEQSRCLNKPLRELKLKDNTLLAAVISGGGYVIPDGNTVIRSGDHAVVVTTHSGLRDLDAILR